MKKLSNVAISILDSGVGYRNDNISSGVINLDKIVKHELYQLYNFDIIDTLKKIYPEFKIPWYTISIPFAILSFIANKLNCKKKDLKGVWLTTKEWCKILYCNSKEERDNITEVNLDKICKRHMFISDLGPDGVLIAYID